MTAPRTSRAELEELVVTAKRILLTILAIATFLLLLAAVTSGAETRSSSVSRGVVSSATPKPV